MQNCFRASMMAIVAVAAAVGVVVSAHQWCPNGAPPDHPSPLIDVKLLALADEVID